MTAAPRRIGLDRPLNRSLRPDDPQFGARTVEGRPGDTPCAHVRLPLEMIANPDMRFRYPQNERGLAKLLADERRTGRTIPGFNDHGLRVRGMVGALRAGHALPPVVGELTESGRARVWDGAHRIAAATIAGSQSVEAYLAPAKKR